MYCSSCGAQSLPSGHVCPQCGGELTDQSHSGTWSVSTRKSVGPTSPGRPVYQAHSQGLQLPAYSRGLRAHIQSHGSVPKGESVGPADPGRPIAYLQGAQSDSMRESVEPADPGRPIAYLQGAQSDSLREYVGPAAADPGRPKAYTQGPRSVPTGETVGPTDPGRPIEYHQGAQSDSMRESVGFTDPGRPKAYTQGPRSVPTGESVGAADTGRHVIYRAHGSLSVSIDALEESTEPEPHRARGPLIAHTFAAGCGVSVLPVRSTQGPRSVPTRGSGGSAGSGEPRHLISHIRGPRSIPTGESVGAADTGRPVLHVYAQGPRSVSTDALEEYEGPGRPISYEQRPRRVPGVTRESREFTDFGAPGGSIAHTHGPLRVSTRDWVAPTGARRPIAYHQGPAQGYRGHMFDSGEFADSADPRHPIAHLQGPKSVSTGESVGPADPRHPIDYLQGLQSVPRRESVGSTEYEDPENLDYEDPHEYLRPNLQSFSLGIQGMNPFAMTRKPVLEQHTKEDIRRSCPPEHFRAPRDEPSMGEEFGDLDTCDTLSCLLQKFRAISSDPNTVKMTTNNLSTLRFVAGMFDKNGGHLTLEHLGIDLYVPPDAVSDANTEIFIFAQDVDEPSRDEVEKWMPPVIQCGPHGLRFNRHVILTVKHPAKDLSEWSFKFQASNTDIGEAPEWKDLTQDPSAMCFTHGDKTVIFVDHFTLFGLVGKLVGAESGEKVKKRRFRMGVFAEPLFRDTEIFQLRVRVWQDNTKEERAVRKKEQHLQGVQLGVDKVLHLAGDGGNVSVVLEWLCPGWQVMENDRQTIPFSSLWNDHAEMPSCTFGLERQPLDTQSRLAYRVTALQVAHPGNSVSIDVLKQLGSRQALDGPSAAPLDPESTFLQLQPELRPTPRCVPQFPSDVQFRRLCLELDLENTAGKDWRSVAEVLHLPYDFIQWARQRSDPTRRLLDFLVAFHGEDSLRVLRDALVEIGHERALQMVEAMMETADNGPTVRAEVQYGATGHQSTDGQPFAGMWHADMHFGSHCTTPKESHSLCAYAPKAVRSGMGNVDGNGSRPSDLQQTLSSGPTSSGSTTVEKVSGERSLGDGQEADASMPSTWNDASGNISHVSSV
uniref:Netrin receptor UNC5 n=1 Tax=Branchiostoma floridae TaxID=7739 RepID=C3YAM0_BRAFL|eukprot:XP_002606758.1 hypothetical protein BRAFLDRAFT_82400 [Branchiostoma floridae]